jgi:hypothetical protein
MKELTKESIIKALESICSEEDLQPYKDLGSGLYELPGNVICNKKALDMYLNTINNESRNNY